LHRWHILSVPFENLDIGLGRRIVLDLDRFYRKIVSEGRGGYCYELNGCFASLLKRLGFRVSMLSARVAGKDGFSPEFDHMTLLVHLEDRWLADVGFGDSFTRPIRIDTVEPQKDDETLYRVTGTNGERVVSRQKEKGNWDNQYSFSFTPRKLSDFTARNDYQQTSPKSHFTQGPLISRLTKSGRITLTDKKFIISRDQKRFEVPVKSRKDFDRLLKKHFHITPLTSPGSERSGAESSLSCRALS
jgi:N-hydroxyarylamine O-acetyltransferase